MAKLDLNSLDDEHVKLFVNVNIKMYINDCIRMYKIVC